MPPFRRPPFLYTAALGLAGWGALAVALVRGHLEPDALSLAFPGFLVVVLAARSLAFRIGATVLSLDSAFYVAAAVGIGPVAGGLLVALALTLDAAVRRRAEAPAGLIERAAFALYLGGMSGGLLYAMASLLPAGVVSARAEVDTIVRVLVLGVAFLLVHNLIQGVRHRLDGGDPVWFIREQALPGVVAEGSLLPLGAVVALLHRGAQPGGLVLLCGTYLLVNLIFNRLARASHGWRRRIRELEQLDHAAQELARSIELPEVIATVCREVAQALPNATAVALVHRGAERDPDAYVVDGLVDGARAVRGQLPRSAGLVAQVVERLTPVAIEDVAAAGAGPTPLGAVAGSWLGVPIFIQGACEGALAVECSSPGAFDRSDQRVLASLALQVGAALGNAHLYAMAMHDGLTGLFVRRYFDARVDEEIARARRYGHPFAIVMIDIDDFKRMNDSHGHLVGDRALREVAAAIRDELRTVDIAARYGGEELALILPRTELVAALGLAERVRARVADCAITLDDGRVVRLTASFGVAAFPDSGADSAASLVKRADQALYRAKRAGKDRCELAWPDDSDDSYPSYPAAPPSIH